MSDQFMYTISDYDVLSNHPDYIDWLKIHHVELYKKIIRNNKIQEILED